MSEKKYYPEEWRGKRYGHLVIRDYRDKHFVCECDCGNTKITKPSFLFNGKVQTCGLGCPYHAKMYPGHSKTRLYGIYRGMIDRCFNPNGTGAKYYHDRGIRVCDEWLSSFVAFKEWAESNGYRDDLTIDRIDPDRNYEPSNCRWATYKQQQETKHPSYTFTPHHKHVNVTLYEANGEKRPLSEWAAMYGVVEETLRYRMKVKNMTLEEALKMKKAVQGRPKKQN